MTQTAMTQTAMTQTAMTQTAMTKTIVVTGAGRGIGRAIAMKLVAEGHRVAALDLEVAGLDELERQVPAEVLHVMRCDVSDERQLSNAFVSLRERFSGLDGLVNNAGIADPRVPPIEQLSLDAWRRVLATNLDGAFLCCKHAVQMLRVRRGAIVNIASTRALQSEPNTEAYAASKGGLVALTHALAISLGPLVRVNAISPGWIDTSPQNPGVEPAAANAEDHSAEDHDSGDLNPTDHAQHPVGRVGVPADVAELTAYLLSEKAGFITGQNFVVDGGMTKKMIYVD